MNDIEGAIEHDLTDILPRLFPGEKHVTVSPVAGGYPTAWGTNNASLRIQLDSGRELFVKRYGDSPIELDVLAGHVEAQREIALHLNGYFASRGFPIRIPEIFRLDEAHGFERQGLFVTEGGGHYSVFEYLPGRFAAWGETSGINLIPCAVGIARLHAGLASYEGPRPATMPNRQIVNSYSLTRLLVESRRRLVDPSSDPAAEELRALLPEFIAAAESVAEEFPEARFRSLPVMVIHGDLAPIHLKLEPNAAGFTELTSVIDWERCGVGTRLWDFIRLLFYQTRIVDGRVVTLPDNLRAFISAYQREATDLAIPLSDDEAAAAPYIQLFFHLRVLEESFFDPERIAQWPWARDNLLSFTALAAGDLGSSLRAPGGRAVLGHSARSAERLAPVETTSFVRSVRTESSDTDGRVEVLRSIEGIFEIFATVPRPGVFVAAHFLLTKALENPRGLHLHFSEASVRASGPDLRFIVEIRHENLLQSVREICWIESASSVSMALSPELFAVDEISLVFSGAASDLRAFEARLDRIVFDVVVPA